MPAVRTTCRSTSRLTRPGDNLDAMLRKLHRGLFVIELMGQGVNYVTGDYSRGAAGFWVEGGQIVHPVHEVTIAGNLRDMLKNIVAVGADAYTYGSKTHRLGAGRAHEAWLGPEACPALGLWVNPAGGTDASVA